MQNKTAGRKDIWSVITLGILLLYALVLVLPLFTLLKESIFKDGALSFEHFGEFLERNIITVRFLTA